HDAASARLLSRRQAEAATQIDHRNDLAAQVDDTFDEAGRTRHPGHRLQANDLMHARDLNAVQLSAELKHHQLALLAAGCSVWVPFVYRRTHRWSSLPDRGARCTVLSGIGYAA